MAGGHRAQERQLHPLAGGGATVWITGLPAAGKSSLGRALTDLLTGSGVAVQHLDGDELRKGLCSDLGFDRESRRENVRRVAEVARLLAARAVAVVSLVSPFRVDRDAARALHERVGVPFVEVWLDTPLAECERRDPKQLYLRARRGELEHLTGLDDLYEAPANPELVLRPQDGDPGHCARLVLSVLSARLSAAAAPAGSKRLQC